MFGEIMPTLDDMLHDASRYMNTLQIQSPKVRNHYNLNVTVTDGKHKVYAQVIIIVIDLY